MENTLSEYITNINYGNCRLAGGDWIKVERIKQFIKDIKEISKGFIPVNYTSKISNFKRFCIELDKLAGDKLT